MSIRTKVVVGSVLVVAVIGLLVFLLGPVLFANIAYPLPAEYRESVHKWSQENCQGIDEPEHLVSALIMTESGWRQSAQSGAGALGMTQIIPGTALAIAKRLGVTNFSPRDLLSDSDLAIRFGSYYICTRIKDYGGNVRKGLIAYNGGGGAVIAFESGSPIRGTVAYADKVINISRAYKTIYGSWWQSPTTNQTTSQTEFNVQPKTDVTLLGNVPLFDFWRGLLSNQNSEAASNNDSGGLNNFWKVFLPGQ